MTIEKAQKDFDTLIEQQGFTPVPEYAASSQPIYHRVWEKEVELAWYGKKTDTLEIRISLSYGIPLVCVKRNGQLEKRFIRDYTSPKRAMNAIREIVRYAGYEM